MARKPNQATVISATVEFKPVTVTIRKNSAAVTFDSGTDPLPFTSPDLENTGAYRVCTFAKLKEAGNII